MAELALGVVPLVMQLASASTQCYKIFDDINNVGDSYDSLLHDLRTQGLRLKGWEDAWGLQNDFGQQRLDPTDYRYRYATASLARIVETFANIFKLQAEYRLVLEKEEKSSQSLGNEARKPRWRDRLSFRSRSKSPLPPSIPSTTIGGHELYLLESPQMLQNPQLLPDLANDLSSMKEMINRVQQCLPIYRKIRWAFSDKAKLHQLLEKLTSLNDGLFQVLPISSGLAADSPVPILKLSFAIPFRLTNLPRNSGFIGREYLLESLKREIDHGNNTLNIIVLYGIGGMGKTQLALEYVYQSNKDYTSVFWINAASEETTILGFTGIMQQLIKYHARLSGNYSHISQLLGMAGKIDSKGNFSVAQPPEAQEVVEAVRQWFTAPENPNWLLVFDNLDDLQSFDIDDYIPSCGHGTVIITSRRPECIKQGRRGFEVHQMQPSEGMKLLMESAVLKYEDATPDGM